MPLNHFSKEIKNNWKGTFVFFVLIGIVVSVGILIMVWWRSEGNRLTPRPPVSTHSSVNLVASYRAELIKLVDDLAQTKPVSDVRVKAEQSLFAMRVPREFLDLHFQTLIAVRSMAAPNSSTDESAVRTQIVERIQDLIDQVDAAWARATIQ
jgi:hypothetical protein